MSNNSRKDSLIAAAITFLVALLILLCLFFGGVTFDRSLLAAASTPELTEQSDELFIEPEVETDLGEANALVNDAPAPMQKGEPEQAEQENTKLVEPGKNEKPAPAKPKQNVQEKPAPVQEQEPPKENEEKKKVTSKMANKFAPNNGSESGQSGQSGAGGTGMGITGSVAGRTFKGCPKPSVELQNKVVVEVRVTINAQGRVTQATARSKSGKASASILSACEQAAYGARWSEDPATPAAKGTLTFTITPR